MLRDDLSRAEAYPAPVRPPEVRETHVSWAFLTDADVYKVKKPVKYPFLDFSTLTARRHACEAEVVLNQRLAAGAYFGVVPVRRGPDGKAWFGPTGEVIDWAVHMVRLPDEARADQRLANGTLDEAKIDALAEHIAAFHARARCDHTTTRWGAVSAIAKNVTENFAEVDPASEGLLSAEQAKELEDWQLDFLETRRTTFERRCREGRVRDGHGDLRLDHVYFGDEGEITILDCIEFSERFRCADVCADVAFLSMDLAAHGRVDLSERFLAKYARAANDFELYALVDFYESYRAYVRAKVATLQGATADARRHFTLALAAHRRTVLSPVVVAVGGIIASGKSTIADAVGDRLSAPVVDADRTRKHMLGLAATEHAHSGAFEGAYDPKFTEKVYAEMLWRAAHVLESGRPVVLDASFRSAEMRRAARDLAKEHGVPFLMIECRARPEVCRARLAKREKETSVSDGRRAIFDAFVARVEPMTELGYDERVVIDTEQPLAESLKEIERSLQSWPRGLVA